MINNIFFSLINKLLLNNQHSVLLLKKYRGKTFIINLGSLVRISAIINTNGYLDSYQSNDVHDTNIGIPLSMGVKFTDSNPLERLKEIHIIGDKQLAIDLLEIFSNIEILGSLYHNLSVPGSIALTAITKLFNSIKATFELAVNNASLSIFEYVNYEQNHPLKDILNNRTTIFAKNTLSSKKPL